MNILLLSGSHRGTKTTSNAILKYLEERLTNAGMHVSRGQVSGKVPDDDLYLRIAGCLENYDALVVCFPLYFDTLPHPLLSLFEAMAEQKGGFHNIDLFCIVHCGLPEWRHCENALAICREFAKQMGFDMKGEAIIPDTGAIEGGRIAGIRRIRVQLDALIRLIVSGETGTRRIARPSMPPRVFRILGNAIMKHFAKKNRADVFQKIYGI